MPSLRRLTTPKTGLMSFARLVPVAALCLLACGSNEGGKSPLVSAGSGGTTAAATSTQPSSAENTASSVPSGAYVMPISVQLTNLIGQGELRCTTDGTAPSPQSPSCNDPLTLTETGEVRAGVFVNGAMLGTEGTWVYVARATDAVSELPLLIIDDYGAGIPTKTVDLKSALLLVDPSSGQSALSQPATLASRAAIHLRGQTSAEFDQRGYKVELRDALDQDRDLPLAGLPSESDFVLHNPYVDKSLIRNAFVYGLGPEMGLASPKFAFVELYFTTSGRPLQDSDYQGVYLLVESIKNSTNRLDLEQLKTTDVALPDITGGYIFKFELDVAEAPTLTCSASRTVRCWQDLEVYDPSPLNPEQRAYLQDYVQAFNNALFGANFADPDVGYPSYVDVNSFVNYFILQELTRNLDAYIRSMYHHKDRSGKIVSGPLWDYNLIGGIGCCGNDPIDGWQFEVTRNTEANGWLQRMYEDPAFVSLVKNRYRELRTSVLSDSAIDARIAGVTRLLSNASARHFSKWPILQQASITYFTTATTPTWEGQVEQLSTWLHARAAWLDSQW